MFETAPVKILPRRARRTRRNRKNFQLRALCVLRGKNHLHKLLGEESSLIKKVISGGQTGVDRAALDAAIEAGIPHGGWVPKGRKAEDGITPLKYNLTELEEGGYAARTEKNVLDSDGTLIITSGAMAVQPVVVSC